MNVLISAREYANKKKISAELLREILKHKHIKPEREIGRSKLFSEELFDRIVEAINNIPLDKKNTIVI